MKTSTSAPPPEKKPNATPVLRTCTRLIAGQEPALLAGRDPGGDRVLGHLVEGQDTPASKQPGSGERGGCEPSSGAATQQHFVAARRLSPRSR